MYDVIIVLILKSADLSMTLLIMSNFTVVKYVINEVFQSFGIQNFREIIVKILLR